VAVKSAHADITQVKLSLEYMDLLAPILGIKSDAHSSERSLVSPQEISLLTKIVQLDPIQINFEIFDKGAKVFISLSDDCLYPYVCQLT
jgi:membrane fusion protein (multidrug efflux system)